MPHPWDRWLGPTMPEPTDTNRLYLGMLAAGLKPISIEDWGKAGRSQGSRTIFACGCERIYRAQLPRGHGEREVVEARESEHIRRCESHQNLLTDGPDWAHNDDVESKARQQQETHDGQHDDPDDHH